MANRLEQLAAITEAYRQKQARIAELQLEIEEIEQFARQTRAVLDAPFEEQAESIEELARQAAEALDKVVNHDLFKLALDGSDFHKTICATLTMLFAVNDGHFRDRFRNSLDALKSSLPDLTEDDDHADF